MSQIGTISRGGRYLRILALLLVAGGLAVVAGSGWQWLGKVRHASHEQTRLSRELDQRWAGAGEPAPDGATAQAARTRTNAARANANPARQAPAAGGGPAAIGTPIARLHVPTLGLALVVLEGAGDAQLATAPGHIPTTHALGAPGNSVVAAHRYPGLFWNLDRLTAGDPVVVETAESWLVYRVVRTVIVQPTDQTVLAAPPDGAPPMLSLATCEPKLSTAQRLVKQAELVRSEVRGGARPRELQAAERQR